MHVTIRPYVDDDAAFVYKAWLLGFKASHFSGPYGEEDYFTAARATIDKLRARLTAASIAIAVTPQGRNAGFVAWQPAGNHGHHDKTAEGDVICAAPALLWAYVKEPLRRMGVATELLRHAAVDPRRSFCFAFMPAGPGRKVLDDRWTAGRFDPHMYRRVLKEKTT